MIKHKQFEITDNRGGPLFAQSWEPEQKPVAGIAIVHGLGDHSSRFDQVATTFANEGFFVMAHDQVGHGHTKGLRGHVPSFSWFLDDIDQLLKQLRTHVGAAPIFLYGQSLGGTLVLQHVLSRPVKVAGVIATSPLLLPAVQQPAWKLGLAQILNVIWPSVTFANGISPSALSHDPDVVDAYKHDPLVHDRISARLAVQMFAAGEWVLEHAKDLSSPALVLHGDADRVTSCDASTQFSESAGDQCTLRVWPGLFHELHKEPEKEAVLSYVCQWMSCTLK